MSEAQDRISDLPASILHHILSFVDTRNAARTSVLSKRWKYIWRSVPILHCWCGNSLHANSFIDFVDRTLELHDESNIQSFSLFSNVLSSEPRIEKWITTVVNHNVEELTLQLNPRDPVLMPPSLYTCESLINLTLVSSPNICIPKYISFPRLKRFIIFGAEFRDEIWNDQLFSSCPVLQFLFLGYCTWSDMKNVCISNPALKELIISNPEQQDGFRICALKIHAPSLQSLNYVGMVPKDCVVSCFPTLHDAHVDFFFEEDGAMWINHGAVVSKYLRALAHVKYLTISDRTLQVLSVADGLLNNLPSFDNLYCLSLAHKVTADIDKALIALLETSPNLEVLMIERFAPLLPDKEEEDDDDESGDDGVEDNDDNEDDGWALDMMATSCSFLQHLRFVFFDKFTGNTREMRWLKLILKNAKALQAVDIHCDSISHRKNKMMEDILRLPRASASCMFMVRRLAE